MSRRMRWKGLVFACAVAVGGCGAAPTALEPAEPASDDGCGPRATRLGGECWSAEGTRWRVTADAPGGPYALELELMAAGRVRATDHASASPARDEWFQDGPLLRVLLGDRFVEYRAHVTNGTVLVGEATNARGQRWDFSARRMFDDALCARGEARLESGACMTIAGTRWTLALEGRDTMIELLDDGALATSAADPAEGDRWSQDGRAVRLTIAGRELTAEIVDPDTLRAEGFTASRVESLPPILWR